MRSSRTIWDMGQLPFHVGVLSEPRNDPFPQRLPFRVGFDEESCVLTQVYDESVMAVLRDVYTRGSQLGVPMGDRGLGKAYADDFRDTIEQRLGDGLRGANLLEIGCGSGHLLGALAGAGARVSGVEPDPRCKAVMEQRGIPVATCTLEEFEATTSYDCIVHYCVLEHAVDPVDFLRRQRELLAPGGRIICAVPDCGAAIRDGDVSIFIHQHWSYFSAHSLRRVAAAAGLRVEAESTARVGALLYVTLTAGEGGDDPGTAPALQPGDFVRRGKRALQRFDAHVTDIYDAGRTLGIYCPVRAINYVPQHDAAWRAVRLFDDAPSLQGKYLPPFESVIEGGEGLEREVVDEIIVMSRPFGAAIESAIRRRPLARQPRVVHVEEVLSHD